MSLYCLRGFGLKFCRQAFILAHKTAPSRCSPVFVCRARLSHNGLYQMVKKRSLEARAKMSQQPLQVSKHDQSNNSMNTTNSSASSTFNTSSSFNSTIPPFAKGVKTYPAKKDAENVSHNTKILGASGCQTPDPKSGGGSCDRPASRGPTGCSDSPPKRPVDPNCSVSSPIQRTPTCPGGGGGGSSSNTGSGNVCGGGGGDEPPKGNKIPKTLLLLLAALGAGGLLFWLTRGKQEEKKVAIVDEDDSECRIYEEEKKPTVPSVSSDLPKQVPYLLIGGGTAAFSAFRAIKYNDARARVLMITNEHRKPYMRPPLSKELWYSAKNGEISPDYRFKQWTGAERSLFFEPEEFFVHPSKLLDSPNGGIAVAHGFTVKKIDPTCHKVTLSDGYEITYEQCLIATGCTPKNLPVFQNASPSVRERVMLYRTPDDFERLKRFADKGKSITVIGNGFIGSELACSLATYAKCRGSKIYQIFAESGNMSRVLPDYLSKWTTRKVEAQGVCVIPNATIRAAQRDENMLRVTLNNGDILLTDIVVVCVGCDPNTNIAYPSGLEVHPELGGFVVNAELEARHDLFVAGDASCFYDPLLGRRRVEHHDHSVVSGKLAGENMTGKKKAYNHQSMFWSDLGPEIGYEAIGLVDSSLPTVGIFALAPVVERPPNSDNLNENREQSEVVTVNPQQANNNIATNTCLDKEDIYGKGVIFYLKNDKVVGILLWNLFNRIGLARTVINQNKKYEDLNEVAKLFEIHS